VSSQVNPSQSVASKARYQAEVSPRQRCPALTFKSEVARPQTPDHNTSIALITTSRWSRRDATACSNVRRRKAAIKCVAMTTSCPMTVNCGWIRVAFRPKDSDLIRGTTTRGSNSDSRSAATSTRKGSHLTRCPRSDRHRTALEKPLTVTPEAVLRQKCIGIFDRPPIFLQPQPLASACVQVGQICAQVRGFLDRLRIIRNRLLGSGRFWSRISNKSTATPSALRRSVAGLAVPISHCATAPGPTPSFAASPRCESSDFPRAILIRPLSVPRPARSTGWLCPLTPLAARRLERLAFPPASLLMAALGITKRH
jgi:hypothetical protein